MQLARSLHSVDAVVKRSRAKSSDDMMVLMHVGTVLVVENNINSVFFAQQQKVATDPSRQ